MIGARLPRAQEKLALELFACGTARGCNPLIRLSTGANSSLGTATSAIWKQTYLAVAAIFAPIIIN